MDFFAAQDRARRNTAWLVVYFGAAVVGTIVAIYLILTLALGYRQAEKHAGQALAKWWRADLFLAVAGGTSAVIVIGTLWKLAQLSGGGGAVARSLGGRRVDLQTRDPLERKLVNVVEEMAIASGIPVPEIYVLDDEEGINAFAAGHVTSDAAVGVTQGCLRALNRAELQGVVAHEFSHILNGDMRLNLRLLGVLHGILCLAIIGRVLLRTSSRRGVRLGARNKGGGNPLPFIGLVLLVVGYIGVFFGRLIKSAISRQREFLADAAAVQFTRQPDGLAGALKKIGGASAGSRLEAGNAEEASHMFFGNALTESWLNLTATHPPLVERIRAIEPGFDGTFPRLAPAEPDPVLPPEPEPVAAGHPLSVPRPPFLPGGIPAAQVVGWVATSSPAHLAYAGSLLAGLPDRLREAAHEPFGARLLVFALLLSPEESGRQAQLQSLHGGAEADFVAELDLLRREVQGLPAAARLPLVELSLPALRQMADPQYQAFMAQIEALIQADQQVDLFEYALQKMLRRHLTSHYERRRPPVAHYYALKPLLPDCECLLSGLAHVGSGSPAAAESAFRQAVGRLGSEALSLRLQPLAKSNLPQMDAALDRLVLASPLLRKQVVDACAHAVASDGAVQAGEAELLRAIADSLDCPLPPLLAAS